MSASLGIMRARIDAFINETTHRFGAPVSVEIRHQGQGVTAMAFEQKDFSGSIFVNDRKDQDTHPDRTGSAKIGGMDYFVNGWLRKTKDDKPYLSLSFKPKQDKPPASNKSRADDFEDAVPF
jgi:hypothetical protein